MNTPESVDSEPFVDWPLRSPTSSLGINIRYYAIDESPEIGARYRIDIGRDHEAILERLYDDFQVAVRGTSITQFEETVRGLFQQRLAFSSAYGIATALYVAMTTDSSEIRRLTRREHRVLASQKRRLPYMTYPQYQNRPQSIWGQVKWFFGGLRARYLRS